VLLQLVHDVIGNEVAFILSETLSQAPNEFARLPQGKSNRKPQHVTTRPHVDE
jgi:hypothetical protein